MCEGLGEENLDRLYKHDFGFTSFESFKDIEEPFFIICKTLNLNNLLKSNENIQ